MKLSQAFAVLSGLILAASGLLADTITTHDGQKLSGQPLEETNEHLKIRHKYGVLTIPKKDIKTRQPSTYRVELKDGTQLEGQVLSETATAIQLKAADGEKSIPLAEVKAVTEKEPGKSTEANAAEVAALHNKARTHWDNKEYGKAIEAYAKILVLDADDAVALYNTACGYALSGEKPRALEFLRKSLEAGFVNFMHIEADSDLDSLRQEPGYKELLSQRGDYTKKATVKAVARINKEFTAKGIDSKQYREHCDPQNNFVYLHTRTDAEFSSIRKGLEEYAEVQWKTLFQNRPGHPLYIVLLSSKDTPKFFSKSVGGVFNPGMNALVCGDSPAFKLVRASVTVHEFTHALHFADQAARRQQHPIWLVEGLATLFETAEHADGKVTPRHNHRLAVVQEALRRSRTMPWPQLTRLNHVQFMLNAELAYAQSRYMLHYMYEKGLLKKFYDEYTKGAGYESDRSASDAYEVVFGKPLAEVENDWRKWIGEQKVPALPFLGIASKASGPDEVKVETVAPGSPAERAGLKAGDIVLAIEENPIKSPDDIVGALSSRKVGDELEVQVLRGTEKLALNVKLGLRSSEATPGQPREPYIGISVDSQETKVMVKEVAAGSPAAKAGLKGGMEILEVDGAKMDTTRDFLAAAKKAKVGDKLKLKVQSGDNEKTVILEVGELRANARP